MEREKQTAGGLGQHKCWWVFPSQWVPLIPSLPLSGNRHPFNTLTLPLIKQISVHLISFQSDKHLEFRRQLNNINLNVILI